MRKPVTISDVAARAGVSPTTVSHALSGRRSVSPGTLARVKEAADDLGYRPNQVASSLRTQRTHTVALIVPDIANPYYPAVARGLHDAIAADGYYTTIGSTDGERETELGFLDEMVRRSVDGIIVFAFAIGEEDLTRVVPARIPLVVATHNLTTAHDQVNSDDPAGTETATRHLLAQGITEIAFVSGPKGRGPGDRRLTGYTQAMHSAGLVPTESDIIRSDYTVAGGRQAVGELLSRPRPPRAVVCANDLIAIGALEAARDAGVAVPADLAVIGFDDVDAASLVAPPLTTVVNPAYEMGRQCGRLLLDRLVEGYGGPPRSVVVPTHLIIRATA
ncbi:LacI family DNA-binding transcriptional regulator [Pseudonocardia sp.]|jgi:LacI family transcriptional regulator|uniref:LacI family DNA-binding transcriptional regulator n=1 Tax=Pseudonocardia sp. TaxID=60912 RepID=UPI0031FE2BB8